MLEIGDVPTRLEECVLGQIDKERFVGTESSKTPRDLCSRIHRHILQGQGSVGPHHYGNGWIEIATTAATQQNDGQECQGNHYRASGGYDHT